MHLFKNKNISPKVIKAIFDKDDLSESAIFKIDVVSPLITAPYDRIMLL